MVTVSSYLLPPAVAAVEQRVAWVAQEAYSASFRLKYGKADCVYVPETSPADVSQSNVRRYVSLTSDRRGSDVAKRTGKGLEVARGSTSRSRLCVVGRGD